MINSGFLRRYSFCWWGFQATFNKGTLSLYMMQVLQILKFCLQTDIACVLLGESAIQKCFLQDMFCFYCCGSCWHDIGDINPFVWRWLQPVKRWFGDSHQLTCKFRESSFWALYIIEFIVGRDLMAQVLRQWIWVNGMGNYATLALLHVGELCFPNI